MVLANFLRLSLLLLAASSIAVPVTEHQVSGMGELFDTVSQTGETLMSAGEIVTLEVRTYTCAEQVNKCDSASSMLHPAGISGTIQCFDDGAGCILDGSSTRRGMDVEGTGSQNLLVKAITFKNGQTGWGGGMNVRNGAIVEVRLCFFKECRATTETGNFGGGAIRVDSSTTSVKVYVTRFEGKSTTRTCFCCPIFFSPPAHTLSIFAQVTPLTPIEETTYTFRRER